MSIYRRAFALMVLGCMFLWNAPAMAFPALIADLGHCDALPKAAPARPAAMHHHHHAGMHMDMGMPVAATKSASMADCLSQHSCCTFNREPAKKSNPYAVAQAETQQETAAPATAPSVASVQVSLPDYRRAVFDLKTDRRI